MSLFRAPCPLALLTPQGGKPSLNPTKATLVGESTDLCVCVKKKYPFPVPRTYSQAGLAGGPVRLRPAGGGGSRGGGRGGHGRDLRLQPAG